MWDKIADTLASQGLSGIAILVEGVVIYWLANQLIQSWRDRDSLQEKRVAERDSSVQALMKSADALSDIAKATEAGNKALDANTRTIDNLTRIYPPRGPA